MSFFNSIFNILRFNKSNWKAVVLCVFAAGIFWLFNALNKNYTTTVSFPLAFDFDQSTFMPVRPLPLTVRINVTGIGWNLFRRSAGLKIPPLVIPLERPAEVSKIVGSTLPASFANQLEDFQINFVLTDTLYLAIEPIATRKLGLAAEIPDVFFRRGYVLVSDVEILPDSVTLEGPKPLVTGLSDPIHLQISQRDIDEDFNEVITLRFLNDELITRSPPTVTVRFDVAELVEVSDSVLLEFINAPDEVREVERKKLPYTIAVPQSLLDSFKTDSLKAVVDLKGFSKGKKKVMPQLLGMPPYSQIIALDSLFIKF